MKKAICLVWIFFVLSATGNIFSQENRHTTATDTLSAQPPPKRNLFRKVIEYFGRSNQPNPDKKFDFSIIGGPHYSSDVQFGIGIVAAGLYKVHYNDPLTPISDVSLYGDVSTTGFYMIGIRGNNLFRLDRWRIKYNVYIYSFPGYFWGNGYENGSRDENKSKYLRLETQVRADGLRWLRPHLYGGISAGFDYVKGKDFRKPELLEGEAKESVSGNAGIVLEYDSRDFISGAYSGLYLKIGQRFFWGRSGNAFQFNRTEFIADYYRRLWKGSVLAFDLHGEFNYGKVPWTLMAHLGGSYRMRGYYDGQYRDKNLIEAQIELRQKIWKRIGTTAWIGAGNVFGDLREWHWGHTLPNGGIGLRWEFKQRVNIRLDYGIGKGQSAFIFSINEAF